MNNTLIALLRLSVSLITFALKGSQDGIVRRRIDVMGLRQWLSLVAAWITETVYAEVARLRDLIVPLPPGAHFKPVTAKNSYLSTDLSLLSASDKTRRLTADVRLCSNRAAVFALPRFAPRSIKSNLIF
jgi:hypothetical protein